MNNKPIFILSSPRSGSTLLRLLLNAHSQVAVPPPTFMFPLINPFLETYGDLDDINNLRAIAKDTLAIQKSKPWPFDVTVEQLVAKVDERSFAGVYRALHELWADHHGKSRWGEKTPPDSFCVESIISCFPDAKIINLIRDGRDVAVDWIENLEWPKNIHATATQWKEFVRAMEPWRETLDSNQLLNVYYETMVTDPENTLQRICAFLELNFEPEMLGFYQEENTAKWANSAFCHRFLTKPITPEFVGIYKQRLTESDIEMLTSLIGEELTTLGYPVEDTPRNIGEAEYFNYFLDAMSAEAWLFEFKRQQREGIKDRLNRGVWSDKGKTKAFG